MWIRRSFGGDALYHTVVQAYIDTILSNGYNFECFVEGGRSRTGKLLPPKYGILSFILDSVSSGRVEDAIICPVSTQYDKVIETEYGQPLISLCVGDADFSLGHTSVNYLDNRNRKKISRISCLLLLSYRSSSAALTSDFTNRGA